MSKRNAGLPIHQWFSVSRHLIRRMSSAWAKVTTTLAIFNHKLTDKTKDAAGMPKTRFLQIKIV